MAQTNESQSNNNLKCVIVNIQYGIGFALIEGAIEIETTFFSRTRRSKSVHAGRNRINLYEEFSWTIDDDTLKYCRTTNEMIKVECFKTPDPICYGNINPRRRIGLAMIKLNEFQTVGNFWNQSVANRNYKLSGSRGDFVLRVNLMIRDKIYLDDVGEIKKRSVANNYKRRDLTNNRLYDQDSIKDYNTTIKSTNLETTNNDYQSKIVNNDDAIRKYEGENDLSTRETWTQISIDSNDKRHKKMRKKQNSDEIKPENDVLKQPIKKENGENRLKTDDECKPNELLANSLKHTMECLKSMRKTKKDPDTTNSLKECSSSSICDNSCTTSSTISAESDSERPKILLRDIKCKLKKLTPYINENVKGYKTRRSRENSNLKNVYCKLISEMCQYLLEHKTC